MPQNMPNHGKGPKAAGPRAQRIRGHMSKHRPPYGRLISCDLKCQICLNNALNKKREIKWNSVWTSNCQRWDIDQRCVTIITVPHLWVWKFNLWKFNLLSLSTVCQLTDSYHYVPTVDWTHHTCMESIVLDESAFLIYLWSPNFQDPYLHVWVNVGVKPPKCDVLPTAWLNHWISKVSGWQFTSATEIQFRNCYTT